MTSELKPCPFCGANAKVKNFGNGRYAAFCENIHKGTTETTKKEAAASWNTRATPPADPLAGLVRYSVMHDSDEEETWIEEKSNGEYVLHSEAAKIIVAEKQASIDARNLLQYEKDQQWRERAEAADAELAQINELLDEGQGDDDGSQILPDFDKGMSALAKVEMCLSLLETRRDVIEGFESKLAQIKAQEPVGYLIGDGSFTPHIAQAHIARNHANMPVIPLYAAPVSDSLKAECNRYKKALQDIVGLYQPRTPIQRAINIARAALNVEASNEQ